MRIDPERSSLTFVRPFLFAPDQADLALGLVRDARAAGREGPLRVWERVPLRTTDWLPHVADALVSSDHSPTIAEAYQLHDDFFQSDRGLAAAGGFEFVPKQRSAAPVPMQLQTVQLILFRNGVGFVAQRWKEPSTSPAVWLDVQHYGRFADLRRGGALRAARNADGSERSFPDPYARRPNDPAHRDGSFAAIDTIALDSAELGPGHRIPTRDVFIADRSLPYAIVFLQSSDDPDWPREEVLYKLRRLFHAVQTHHPTADQERIAPPHFHPYLKDQWFFPSLEGGGFVAIDAPADDFFRHSLPDHLETEYFLLFVLALQQRFTLMALSAEVAQRWTSHPGEQSRRELRAVFERIRDRLFDFTARYQFVQVGQRENHHRVYQMWRETFQTRELYEEVCSEVREMSEYLHDRDRQAGEDRIDRLTLLLTVLIGAPSLAIGFWGINIKGITNADGPSLGEVVQLVLGMAIGLASLFAVVGCLLRRK